MVHSRSTALLLVLTAGISPSDANAQSTDSASRIKQHVLYLNAANASQTVVADVGQPIQITLGTVGPGQYNSPQVSSSAVRFEGVTFPKEQIPAGPTQVYRFRAVSVGQAQIKIEHKIQVKMADGADGQVPYRDPNPTFVLKIRVRERRTQ